MIRSSNLPLALGLDLCIGMDSQGARSNSSYTANLMYFELCNLSVRRKLAATKLCPKMRT